MKKGIKLLALSLSLFMLVPIMSSCAIWNELMLYTVKSDDPFLLADCVAISRGIEDDERIVYNLSVTGNKEKLVGEFRLHEDLAFTQGDRFRYTLERNVDTNKNDPDSEKWTEGYGYDSDNMYYSYVGNNIDNKLISNVTEDEFKAFLEWYRNDSLSISADSCKTATSYKGDNGWEATYTDFTAEGIKALCENSAIGYAADYLKDNYNTTIEDIHITLTVDNEVLPERAVIFINPERTSEIESTDLTVEISVLYDYKTNDATKGLAGYHRCDNLLTAFEIERSLNEYKNAENMSVKVIGELFYTGLTDTPVTGEMNIKFSNTKGGFRYETESTLDGITNKYTYDNGVIRYYDGATSSVTETESNDAFAKETVYHNIDNANFSVANVKSIRSTGNNTYVIELDATNYEDLFEALGSKPHSKMLTVTVHLVDGEVGVYTVDYNSNFKDSEIRTSYTSYFVESDM